MGGYKIINAESCFLDAIGETNLSCDKEDLIYILDKGATYKVGRVVE